MVIVFTIIILLTAMVSGFFLFAPQLGKKACGNRLERMKNSPNFSNGQFQNPVNTVMQIPPFKAFKEMRKMNVDRVPEKPLTSYPIDNSFFDNNADSNIVVTWLGHSTVLLKINGIVVLIDPVFSKRASIVSFVGPEKFQYTHDHTVEELPPVDVVVISHDHYDHLDYKTILKLKNSVKKFYMPLGVGAHLERWGVPAEKIVELDWWDVTKFDNLEFIATPSRHFTGRRITDRFQSLWCRWAIKSNNGSVFFSGDSGYFDGFKEIGEKLGPFDLSFLECGQYNKYWPNIHMMPEESVQAAIDCRSKVALPVHWGKYSLSMHPWYEPPTRFLKKAREMKLAVAMPAIGQTFSLDAYPDTIWWK